MTKKNNIIIIGSGLGGLQSGVILSRKGYKVLVLEQNYQVGGSLQTFKRRGCTFSTGMHYIGSLDEGQTLNKIFKYFNLFDGIEYKRLDEKGIEYLYKSKLNWRRLNLLRKKATPGQLKIILRVNPELLEYFV